LVEITPPWCMRKDKPEFRLQTVRFGFSEVPFAIVPEFVVILEKSHH